MFQDNIKKISCRFSSDSTLLFAKHHYEKAKVDNHIYNINDDVYVQVNVLNLYLLVARL